MFQSSNYLMFPIMTFFQKSGSECSRSKNIAPSTRDRYDRVLKRKIILEDVKSADYRIKLTHAS